MRFSTLSSLAATALLASANPRIFPPLPSLFPAGPAVGSIVSTALETASIPSAVAPAVASVVAAAPAVPNNASPDSISGLDIPPAELVDNILAAIAILDLVLALLNPSESEDDQTVKVRDLDLPIPSLADLEAFGGLGATIIILLSLVIPLLSTSLD